MSTSAASSPLPRLTTCTCCGNEAKKGEYEGRFELCDKCGFRLCHECAEDIFQPCACCEMTFCDRCLEVVGAGCTCVRCPNCMPGARDKCPECGELAVFCYECDDTGDQEETDPLCPSCYKKKEEEEEESQPPANKKARVAKEC